MNSGGTQTNDGQSTAAFWSAVAADKAEFRSRVTRAAETGDGAQAFHESLSLLGIDANRIQRPKLVAINGVRLAKR